MHIISVRQLKFMNILKHLCVFHVVCRKARQVERAMLKKMSSPLSAVAGAAVEGMVIGQP